jgi:acetate---CoA ligase (ADP-forming)
MSALDPGLLSPRSIAIVGASDVTASPGRQAVENLVNQGYTGSVWPVNPRYESVAGVACYASLDELPGVPEAVFVLIAAAEVPRIAATAAALGTRLLVVASSGIGEGTLAEGQALVARVREAVAGSSMRILGPNTEGMWNVADRCFVTFGSALRLMPPPHAGNVAVISQSGSIGAALGWRITAAGAGLSYVAMTGNELDLDALDICELVLADPATTTVAMFLEGLRDGGRLLELGARAAAAGKRIVALKSGRSGPAKLATLSHTGKFASDEAIYDAAFAQAGIIRVMRIEELVRAAATLATTSAQPSKGVGVVAVSGGSRSIVADAAASFGVPLPDFAPETETTLRGAIRDFSSTRNPCDIGGWSFSSVESAQTLLTPILADPNTDTVLVQFASRGREESVTCLRALRLLSGGRPSKPVVLSLLTDGPSEECLELAAELGVVVCNDPTVAVQTLSFLYQGRDDRGEVEPLAPAAAARTGTRQLSWGESVDLVQGFGVEIEGGETVGSADEAAGRAAALGANSYVLKLYPDDSPHKTDVGGVIVGLRGPDEVAAAFGTLSASPAFRGRALLQRQVPAAAEALVAILRDPDFGLVLCVGSGGVDVETNAGKAFGILPLDRPAIRAVVERSGVLASGQRAGRENDAAALVELIHQLCAGVKDDVSMIELNPVMVGAPGAGARAVDALIEVVDFEDREPST